MKSVLLLCSMGVHVNFKKSLFFHLEVDNYDFYLHMVHEIIYIYRPQGATI
jgi:hypothetical protein